jgi:protein-tyrosine phosphatase
MAHTKNQSILFVCTGNTCRSPMAEAFARHLTRSIEGWTFASAGVFAHPGAPASQHSIEVMKEKGIDLTGHKARLADAALLEQFDWIVPMTEGHQQMLLKTFPLNPERVPTLMQFSSTGQRDIMDPFGGLPETYRRVRDQIEGALSDLILAVIQPSG